MRFKLSCEGVCVKSLPPPRTSGELPGPFWPLPSRCCLQRKVPVCPSLLNPGEGVMHSRTKQPQSNKTNLHTQTYTDTKVHDHPPPISLGFPVSGGDPGSTAPQGLKGQVQSVARRRPVTPCAQRQGSRGGVLAAAGREVQPSRGGRRRRSTCFLRRPWRLKRPRWLCSTGSCLSALAYRSRSARARRLPDRPPPQPRLPRGRPRGFSVRVRRSWNRRC